MWLLLLLLLACSAFDPDDAPADVTADTDPPAGGFTPADVDLTDWVAAGAGSWVGEARDTPLGDLPFALDLAFDDDGDLTGDVDSGAGFTLAFRYHQGPDGRWQLTEAGQMPPYFEQSYTLQAASIDGDRVVWVTPDDPDFLVVRVDHTGETLRMAVRLRGERHAVLDLAARPR